MSPGIATFVYAIGILGLFLLNRDQDSPTSKALWIPVIWLLIIASRPVSQWLNVAPAMNSTDQYLDGSPLDRAVFAVLLALGLIVLFIRKRRVTTLLSSNWPLLLFFLYCALSTTWSDYADVAFKRWIKALGDLVMALIVLTDLDPSAAVRRLLNRVSFVLLPASVLLNKYFPDLGRTYTPDFGYWQQFYIGVTTGKNSLGALTLICGLGALWQFTELFHDKDMPNRRRRALAQGAILAFVGWIFWTANSVTSLSCFLAGAALLLATSRPRFRRPAVVHALTLAILCFAVFVIFVAPALLAMLGRDSTLTGRTQIWSTVLAMPVNRWIGTGFESFWLGERMQTIWNLWWWHPNETHNGYIEILLNLGWIGVSLFALFLAAGYRRIVSRFCDVSLAKLELTYFLIALIYSFTEAGFRMLAPSWFFLLLAIISAGVPLAETQSEIDGPYEIESAQDNMAVGASGWSDPEPEGF